MMRGYISSSGRPLCMGPRSVPRGALAPRALLTVLISEGRTNPPRPGRGLGVIPGPSVQQVTSLPLTRPSTSVQQTLAQAAPLVPSSSFSWLDQVKAWAGKEAITGTGISNGLLYGGAGFLLLLALMKGRRLY